MIRADKRRYHYIYKITRFDGKFYIGMHSTDNLEDVYFGSGKLITCSIKKHGIDKHSKEILEYSTTRVELKIRERQLVNEEIIDDPKCMNLRLGGTGWESTEASAAAVLGNKSKKRNHKNIVAKSLATKISRGTNIVPNPRTFGMLGKVHSDLSKIQMSLSGSGEKNSQFGSCWVTKAGIKPFKIKKEQLDEYISNGYSRGRKILGC